MPTMSPDSLLSGIETLIGALILLAIPTFIFWDFHAEARRRAWGGLRVLGRLILAVACPPPILVVAIVVLAVFALWDSDTRALWRHAPSTVIAEIKNAACYVWTGSARDVWSIFPYRERLRPHLVVPPPPIDLSEPVDPEIAALLPDRGPIDLSRLPVPVLAPRIDQEGCLVLESEVFPASARLAADRRISKLLRAIRRNQALDLDGLRRRDNRRITRKAKHGRFFCRLDYGGVKKDWLLLRLDELRLAGFNAAIDEVRASTIDVEWHREEDWELFVRAMTTDH